MSNVKSYEELAEIGYLAYCKAAGLKPVPFHQGDPAHQAHWMAVARQLWAEFAAMH